MPIEVFELSKIQQLGTVDLDLHGAKLLTSSNDTAILSTATVPKWDLVSTGALSSANPLVLSWSSAGSVARVMCPPFSTPADWSTRGAVVVNIVASKGSTAGAPTISVKMQAADPTNGLIFSSATTGTLAQTASASPALVTASFAATAIPGVNSVIGWSIAPSTSADAVRVHGGWITYQRAPRG